MILVRQISTSQIKEWVVKKHYAKRMPSISLAFGLFIENELSGVVTYGSSPSPLLSKGIAGDKWKKYVIELNRLVVNEDNIKNAASILVGRSLQKLKKPTIVVSFADTEQGHVGYIYQATNFLYAGLSAKRKNWKVKGLEHIHSKTLADKARNKRIRPIEYMKKTYGDKFYYEDRPRKHRYIYIVANKKDKIAIKKDLKHPIGPYPKGESIRYDASYKPKIQLELF